MLDRGKASKSPVPQQLYRYGVLAEWMAKLSDSGIRPYLCNLTRAGHEVASQDGFSELVTPAFRDHFATMNWEDIHGLSGFERKKLGRLSRYLENTTINLRQPFRLDRKWC